MTKTQGTLRPTVGEKLFGHHMHLDFSSRQVTFFAQNRLIQQDDFWLTQNNTKKQQQIVCVTVMQPNLSKTQTK